MENNQNLAKEVSKKIQDLSITEQINFSMNEMNQSPQLFKIRKRSDSSCLSINQASPILPIRKIDENQNCGKKEGHNEINIKYNGSDTGRVLNLTTSICDQTTKIETTLQESFQQEEKDNLQNQDLQIEDDKSLEQLIAFQQYDTQYFGFYQRKQQMRPEFKLGNIIFQNSIYQNDDREIPNPRFDEEIEENQYVKQIEMEWPPFLPLTMQWQTVDPFEAFFNPYGGRRSLEPQQGMRYDSLI